MTDGKQSIVDLLKTIMGHPNVDQETRDQASGLLLKVSPEDHPTRKVWDDIFGSWGRM